MVVNLHSCTGVSDHRNNFSYIFYAILIQYTIIKIFLSGTLLTFLVIFLSLPLCNPILDVILPLNETRPRQNIFNVNYIILDNYEYFYIVYMHLSCSAAIIVIIIISVDSLYISIIYHACGLFAACG